MIFSICQDADFSSEPDSSHIVMIVSIFLATALIAVPPVWFRFVCRLILTGEPVSGRLAKVAEDQQLRLLEVQRRLRDTLESAHLDRIFETLVHDYMRVRRSSCVEHYFLRLNFRFLRLSYIACRATRLSDGRRALEEMAQTVGYFTNRLAATIPS